MRGYRGGSAWANHPSLPPLPSSERGRTGKCAQQLRCSLLQKPAPTPLSLICFAVCSFLCGVTVSRSLQTALKSIPSSAQHRKPFCRASKVFGQGYQPAKTPMCQTELFLALHHTLAWFKASLTVGKVSHYQALPPADHPIQQEPVWGGWQRGDHPSHLPLLCQHLQRALGWCRCTENPT